MSVAMLPTTSSLLYFSFAPLPTCIRFFLTTHSLFATPSARLHLLITLITLFSLILNPTAWQWTSLLQQPERRRRRKNLRPLKPRHRTKLRSSPQHSLCRGVIPHRSLQGHQKQWQQQWKQKHAFMFQLKATSRSSHGNRLPPLGICWSGSAMKVFLSRVVIFSVKATECQDSFEPLAPIQMG
ncbi:hypothetical protein BKA57DRAFT_476216 [Linnemannia elongata]|nr:hypothetical protein BKA57DRAFT_476216 [Linnemannia elongata]